MSKKVLVVSASLRKSGNSDTLCDKFVRGARESGNVAVKISSGEPGGHNFLQPLLIGPLVRLLGGTIVECNTAYEGKRSDSSSHWQAIRDHGFPAIDPCDIMDEFGEFAIPVTGGKHLTENSVGSHLKNYDSMLMLSRFKGHLMGGFGGALKNMPIGVASAHGKTVIHGAGDPEKLWTADHDSFLESMAEADQSAMDFLGRENIVYSNVANRLSVDCDCDSNPHEPKNPRWLTSVCSPRSIPWRWIRHVWTRSIPRRMQEKPR